MRQLSNIVYHPVHKEFGIILWIIPPFEDYIKYLSYKIRGKGIWADGDCKRLTVEQAKKLLQFEEKFEDVENPWSNASEKCLKYIGLDENLSENTIVAKDS